MPEPSVDPELLTNVDAGAMQQNRFVQLITYLDLVMTPNMDAALDGTAVDDFVVELFKILGYVH